MGIPLWQVAGAFPRRHSFLLRIFRIVPRPDEFLMP
jgi:hypothetical protein